MELVNTISHINNHLCDDESKKLFNARLKYSLSKNEKLFIEESGIMSQDLSCREWEDFTKTLSPNISVVIFGAGTDGVYTYNLLKRCNWGKNVVAFCDNNMSLWNTKIEELLVYSIDDVKAKYSDAIIVIASRKYVSDIYCQLLINGFNRNNVFLPSYKRFRRLINAVTH